MRRQRSIKYIGKVCKKVSHVKYTDKNRGKEMLNIIEIKDFHSPELDVYARRTEAQLLNKDHPEEGMFITESPKVIGRALDAVIRFTEGRPESVWERYFRFR